VPNRTSHRAAFWPLWLLFAAELVVLLILQWPVVADFQKFAYYDEGAALHADALYSSGAIPTIDFGYSYGLLALLAGHPWFYLFGRTPHAYLMLITLLNLLAVWPIATILDRLRAGPPLIIAALVMLPLAITPSNYSLMHPLEALLLLHALAAQLDGRYRRALMWCTAAIFIKPTMAYALGAILIALAALRWRQRSSRSMPVRDVSSRAQSRYVRRGPLGFLTRLLAPAAGVAVVGITIESAFFSPLAMLHNLLPLTGGRSYKAMNFGFFHAGRDFWFAPQATFGQTLAYYFFSPAAWWITASIVLWIMALRAVLSALAGETVAPRQELLITLALMHGLFVFVFYAWAGSWTYYAVFLFLGLLLAIQPPRERPRVTAAARPALLTGSLVLMTLLACAANIDRIGDAVNRWKNTTASSDTAGLYAFPDQAAEFARARLDADSTLFLTNGCLHELFPELHTPPSWFLSPAIPLPGEMAALRKRIADSDHVVLVNDYARAQPWNWPELADQTKGFTVDTKGNYLTVMTRTATTTR
jgi:hypothetical protein